MSSNNIHSEIIERSMDEWEQIFKIERKNYGIKVTKYKGNQKIIYIPDFVNRAVGISSDCAVICRKTLFDKFTPDIKVNSAIAYLREPELYLGDYSDGPRQYIKRSSEIVIKRLIEEGSVELLNSAIDLIEKKVDMKILDEMIVLANHNADMCNYLIDLKSKKFCPDDIERLQRIQEEKALGIREMKATDWKKLWTCKRLDDGSLCLSSYKGEEESLIAPAKIGDNPVSVIGAHVMVPWNVKKKRDQRFIERKEKAKKCAGQIKTILIQQGISQIGEWAFYGCTNLESIFIPESVSLIENAAFYNCLNITIHAPVGSYAAQYAKRNNIPLVEE